MATIIAVVVRLIGWIVRVVQFDRRSKETICPIVPLFQQMWIAACSSNRTVPIGASVVQHICVLLHTGRFRWGFIAFGATVCHVAFSCQRLRIVTLKWRALLVVVVGMTTVVCTSPRQYRMAEVQLHRIHQKVAGLVRVVGADKVGIMLDIFALLRKT